LCLFDAPILDVGLLTVAGVSCEASDQPAHSQAISCSPNALLERDGKALIDLVDGLSSRWVVLVSVTDGDLADHDARLEGEAAERLPSHRDQAQAIKQV